MDHAGAKLSACDELTDYTWEDHAVNHTFNQILIAKVSFSLALAKT
jgi:hypothetical protein